MTDRKTMSGLRAAHSIDPKSARIHDLERELKRLRARLAEAERLLGVLCESHQYTPHVRAYLRDLRATDNVGESRD